MRSRIVRPGLFENENLGEVGFGARILFVGLWCLADREGRLEDRGKRIKSRVFAYDGDVDVEGMLADLADKGFIIRYEADDTRLIQIVNFAKHQKVHIREAASIFPAPPGYVPALPEPDLGTPEVDLGDAKATPRFPSSTSTSTSTSTSVARSRKLPPIPMTDEQRQKLIDKFAPLFGAEALDIKIAAALNHEALDKAKTEYFYVQNWLNTEKERLLRSRGPQAISEPRPKKYATGMEHV